MLSSEKNKFCIEEEKYDEELKALHYSVSYWAVDFSWRKSIP